VVFVGLFSTHLTYIILAIIYIFGYGTYALNTKQKHAENKNPEHSITTEKKRLNTSCEKNTYFYHEFNKNEVKNCKTKNIRYLHLSISIALPFMSADLVNWTSYNWSLLPETRPSPLYIHQA
jgi:hypothetical protein